MLFVAWFMAAEGYCQTETQRRSKPAASQTESLQVPEDVVYCPDLVYCTPGNKTQLTLDLAYPKNGKGPYPAVVCLHGGGWMRGSCKKHVPLTFQLAKEGFVALTVDYRLIPVKPFPAPVHDVKCAVRWLRANAEKYHVDKERIGALGFSSGGNLACLLGSTTPQDGLEGEGGFAEESSRVQAVVSFYGLTDLIHLHDCCTKKTMPIFEANVMKIVLEKFLGGPPSSAAELYAKASPITYARKDSAPTLLIHGTADRKVPFEQSQRYQESLRRLGVKVDLILLADAPHDFEGEFEVTAFKAAIEFLKKELNWKEEKK
jgi:acetyl esterase/lipase